MLRSVASLGLALTLAACGPSSRDGAGTSVEVSSQSSSTQQFALGTGSAVNPALLRRMQQAPLATRYQGERRVEQRWKIRTTRQILRYRERVSSDGAGQFALEPLQLVEPQLSASERAIWTLLQEARDGFLFRYRDFAIRDARAFARNYTITQLGTSVHVAGRACEELAVQRKQHPQLLYTLAVDRATGLILRVLEERFDTGLESVMEFESIDFAPAFQPAPAWNVPSNDEQPLPAGHAGAALLGFEPRVPLTDGESFVLLGLTRLTSPDPDSTGTLNWAKAALTDGLEVVLFLHGGTQPGWTGDDVMRVSPSVGPWNHVEGTLRGERVMAIGRVSADELLDLAATVL